jgi:3',5'-cyclic AMP phosphodiesterase CpdA
MATADGGVPASGSIRLAHFSDIHLTTRPLGWALHDLPTKRLTGWFHLRALGRGGQFRLAHEVARALVHEFRERRPDRIVFAGDATALGFASEAAHAARRLHVGDPGLPPGLAVPGNHDYYTRASVLSAAFERDFAPWQSGERVDEVPYPFAQRVGPLWLIGVNSCRANMRPWDASGAVGKAQRDRLRDLLRQLTPGPRVLVTHYPVCLADGRPETRWHGLRDLESTVRLAADGGVGLWLHGHRHRPYVVARPPQAPFPVICCGSASQMGRAGYGEYEIDGRRLTGRRRVYDSGTAAFRESETFELNI